MNQTLEQAKGGAAARLVATFFYTGHVPVAPGTAGSAATLLLFALVRWTGSATLELAVLALVVVAGVWAAGAMERQLGVEDPGQVVIDETAGMLVTLVLVPVGIGGAIAGFVLFRVFDIVKPYPCARLERLGGGPGIMADDLMAGVYAHVVLRLLMLVLPGLA